MIGWIPRRLLWLVVRTQTSHSAAWFGGEDTDPILLGEGIDTSPSGSVYLSLPLTRQDLRQGQRPEGRIIVGGRGGKGWARAEVRALLDYAGHRLT